jgi:SH3 domain-containing YSC84-like protein 1
MPLGINNFLPSSLKSTKNHFTANVPAYVKTGECKKAGKILASFIDPRQAFGPDKVIPPEILANAKVRKTSTCILSCAQI